MAEDQKPESEGNGKFIDQGDDYYDPELGQMGETVNEEELSGFRKKMFQRREQRLKKKLKKIIEKAPSRPFLVYMPWEIRDIEEAKKHKNLREDLEMLSFKMNWARTQKTFKGISSIPASAQPLMWTFIIILIICVLVSIAYSLGLIGSDGNDLDPNADGTSPNGPKGKDFYAVRAVYTDEEQAEIDQIGDYIDILRGVKEQIDTDISGLEITFNLGIPEDAEIGSFIENKTEGGWPIAYETTKEMADVVYKYDNEGGAETELEAQLNAIKYFGYNADIISISGDNNDLTDIIKANLEQYKDSLFDPIEDGGEIPADLMDTINSSVDTYMDTVSELRAEKYYVKDFVLDGDDATMEGIKIANYKAIIMYAREDFEAQYMNFIVADIDTEQFVTYIDDNGMETEFNKVPSGNDDIFNDLRMPGDNSSSAPEQKRYNYEIDHSFNIGASEMPTYLNTIVEGKDTLNLYEILIAQKDEIASSTLLAEAKDTEGNTVENVYSYTIVCTEFEQ